MPARKKLRTRVVDEEAKLDNALRHLSDVDKQHSEVYEKVKKRQSNGKVKLSTPPEAKP